VSAERRQCRLIRYSVHSDPCSWQSKASKFSFTQKSWSLHLRKRITHWDNDELATFGGYQHKEGCGGRFYAKFGLMG
jgi:hypothetical protein